MTILTSATGSTAQEMRDLLQRIIDTAPASLDAAVADEALHYDDDPTIMFINLARSGCAGGTINSLIYLRDTNRFFEVHYDDIEDLREDYETNAGEPLRINGDLKNWLAWFAFEETAFRIARETLGLDL